MEYGAHIKVITEPPICRIDWWMLSILPTINGMNIVKQEYGEIDSEIIGICS